MFESITESVRKAAQSGETTGFDSLELERSGERVTNIVRSFLLLLFGAGATLGYLSGGLKDTIQFFIAAVALYALSLVASLINLRLKHFRRGWKYVAMPLEFLALFLIQTSYVVADSDIWTIGVKSATLYGVYVLLLGESSLRFSERFLYVSTAVAVFAHSASYILVLTLTPASLANKGYLTPDAIDITDWVLGGLFLAALGLMLARAARYARKLLQQSVELARQARGREERIRELFSQASIVTTEARDTSKEMRDVSAALGEESRNQLASIEETSASMEQMTASIRSIAERAEEQDQVCTQNSQGMEGFRAAIQDIEQLSKKASDGGGSALESLEAGDRDLGEALAAMQRIQEGAGRVSEIVTVINDISERTNLLALNASIEAARAGEEGRGFSVVADEVGKLADLSRKNAREIDTLLRETRTSTDSGAQIVRRTVEQLRDIIEGVKDVIQTTDRVHRLIAAQTETAKRLSEDTDRIQNMARSVRDATAEQLSGAREIMEAADSIQKSSQSFAERAEELRAGGDRLSKISAALEAAMSAE